MTAEEMKRRGLRYAKPGEPILGPLQIKNPDDTITQRPAGVVGNGAGRPITAPLIPPNASAGTTASASGVPRPPPLWAAPSAAPTPQNEITDPAIVNAQRQTLPPGAGNRLVTEGNVAVPIPASTNPLKNRTPASQMPPDGGTAGVAAPRLFVDSDGRARVGYNMGQAGKDVGLAEADEQGVPLGMKMVPVSGLTQGSAQVGVAAGGKFDPSAGPALPVAPSLLRRETRDGRPMDMTPYYGPGAASNAAAKERQAEADARTAAIAERFNLSVVRPSLIRSAAPGVTRDHLSAMLAQDMAARGYDTLGRRAAADAAANQRSLIGAKSEGELALERERTSQERVKGTSAERVSRTTGELGVQGKAIEAAGAVSTAQANASAESIRADQSRSAQEYDRERAVIDKLNMRNEASFRSAYDDLAAWTNQDTQNKESDKAYAKRVPEVYAKLALMESAMIRKGMVVPDPKGIRGLLKTVVLENAPPQVQQTLAARMMRGETINQIIASSSDLAQFIDRKKLRALPLF